MNVMHTTRHIDGIDLHVCLSTAASLHNHNFLELAYVAEGEAEHLLNGQKTVVSKGDFFILDYDALHSYKSIGNRHLRVINCLFLPEFIDRSLQNHRSFGDVVNSYMLKYNYSTVNISPANYIFRDEDGAVLLLLERMLKEYEEKQSGYKELLRCHLIEIIIRTMRLRAPALPACQDALCLRIIEFADTHLTEKNILGRLCAEVNFSESYLSRHFKETMGVSFSQYLTNMRIERCCRLLANTNKRITEIAHLSGYTDMKFFGAVFKKKMGITPREFQKRIR